MAQPRDLVQELTGPGGPFEIREAVVRGIPTRVYGFGPRTLVDTLRHSRQYGDRTFVVYEDDAWTYAEHFDVVAKLADRFVHDMGVEKGTRVAIAMRNFPEWIATFWATAAAGGIVVPLNAWWTGAELEYALADSGATVLVADAERAERLGPHLDGTAVAHRIVARGAVDGWLDVEEVVGASSATELPDVAIDPEDDATIFYTSGTTGVPKGAVGTHRNICTITANAELTAARGAAAAGRDLPPHTERPQQGRLLSVPLFHVTGCHATMVGSTWAGSKLVMMYRWNPERALELIERERLTSFGGVPSMVWEVLESPKFGDHDLSSVQSIGYGGAPAPPELVRRITEHFELAAPGNGYGLTETSSVAVANGGADYVRKPHSIGRPLPVVDVRIVDPAGDDVPLGEVGELLIKGPNVVRGYWNKPEETARTFVDGWLHTGDLATLDEEGFVTIADRAKDVVIRGGENVYCAEVEGALYEHPAVTEACVLGVPHRVLGEEVGAVIVLRPGAAATAEDLQAHVKERLAGFKVPTHVWFRDEPLPRNPAGKVLKRELRDELTAS
ncbi:class I adenylate-forming enzyme family protein [Actinomarinicola tropica]|uniref:AMP-binding protein n=1 Tax=Actinomarinicola tropica TaxID=2789776 RepID=A0A5Q2RLL4_9ACTN|nr:class I adenylate-forming enzyme family protein [Actinomarinicola tropica]QGG94967.1 AMP-binding protein [Actinomarinicola tropica]